MGSEPLKCEILYTNGESSPLFHVAATSGNRTIVIALVHAPTPRLRPTSIRSRVVPSNRPFPTRPDAHAIHAVVAIAIQSQSTVLIHPPQRIIQPRLGLILKPHT